MKLIPNISINIKRKSLGYIILLNSYRRKISILLATLIKKKKIIKMMAARFTIKYYKKQKYKEMNKFRNRRLG